ncbi:uncharacterized protein H6S33_000026 [Morchella sextelata]|uniref:uncharacterized protein n=1 Tax=Morchella sextelata TaxID=1174677 RepID=UPI001D0570E6|nr:uncharacterized protein H6S33_000026 [Morchella sextelata]KAH0614390.1 hypothetical protein H6S33_000026 [Morchella sextelata]
MEWANKEGHWILSISRAAYIAEGYAKKSKFTSAEVKSLLSITLAQWRNMFKAVYDYFVENAIAGRTMGTDEQWDETVRLLLSYPHWNKFRRLLQQPEEDCTFQGALIKVCVSSILQDLAKGNSTEDREKFSEALKQKKRAAKSAKVKAEKNKVTKGKATDTKGKGKQRETAPTRSSIKRSKQAQASLPNNEDEVYPDIDEFAWLEDKPEKRREKADIRDETDDEETSEEADEPFSVKTGNVERPQYLTDQPIGISHFFPSKYRFERLGGVKLGLRQYRVYQLLPEQVIFLRSDKDVRVWLNACKVAPQLILLVIYNEHDKNASQTPPPLSFPYFYGDWEVLMDNQFQIYRRALSIKAEETGTRKGKATKRKRSEIVEVSNDADDDDTEDDADDDNEDEGESGGSSSCKNPRGENAGEGSSSKAAQKDDDNSDDDDE